jgi:murein L,D-transpeptidase YcbB/YkuD
MRSKLTSKQAAFCRHVTAGSSLSEAYRKSYNASKMKPATVRREAHTLMNNPNVATTVESLERKAEVVLVEKTIADRKEVLETLTQMMRGELETDSNKVRATQLLAQAHGILKDHAFVSSKERSSEDIKSELESRLRAFIREQQSKDLASKELVLFGNDQP